MKKVIWFALVMALTSNLYDIEPVFAGNCSYSYQTAKDGSRCGARARSARKSGSYAH
jgi:hypothetical protein